MTEDKKLTQLIINELTKAQYEALGDNVNEDEIYVITDDEVEIKSDGETIVGKGTKADPLAISPEFIEKVDTEISDRQNAISSLEQSINNTINELDEKLTESDANLQDQIAANSESITNLDKNKVNKSSLGIASGVATLDANAKVPMSQINDSLLGNVQYQGLYDVSTNTPNLDIVETKGHYYVVSVAGDRFDISFEVGDWIISNGVTWDKVDNTDAVSSVNGRTGNVVITKEDIDLSEHVKFTDYAGQDKAGVIKTSNGFGMSISATGCPLAVTATKSEYDSVNATYFIGKGTLENIKNDLVKRAVTENDITLTDEEKTAARTWIGAGSQTAQGDLQNELKNKADQSDTYTKSEVDGAIETVADKVQKNTEDIAAHDESITTLEAIKANASDLTSHTSDVSNPHKVTKTQVGLGNVDNTSDMNKPVSTSQHAAINSAISTEASNRDNAIKTAVEAEASARQSANTNLQSQITATNSEVAKKANSADLAEVATTGSYEDLVDTPDLSIYATDTELNGVSERVTTIEGKIPAAATATNQLADKAFVNSSINNLAAFYLTSNVTGDAFATKAALVDGPYYFQGATRTPTLNDYAIVIADETKNNSSTRYMYDGTQWDFQYVINDTPFTQNQVNAINSTATKEKIDSYSAHITNTSNPHVVTKSQVGLGNVDNTADLNKPVSTAQQAALNLKSDKSTTYSKTEVDDLLAPKLDSETAEDTYATIANLNAHTTNKSNPHGVTKAQVGLGNVDNTSDLAKPVSTATQAALDGKQNTLTQAQLNAVNSGITAAKVSTYDNYATEIAGKQPAGDYATNTSLSQGLDGKVDKNQGVASAGKVLAVNEQGVVEPTEIKAGGVNATYDATNHRITFA